MEVMLKSRDSNELMLTSLVYRLFPSLAGCVFTGFWQGFWRSAAHGRQLTQMACFSLKTINFSSTISILLNITVKFSRHELMMWVRMILLTPIAPLRRNIASPSMIILHDSDHARSAQIHVDPRSRHVTRHGSDTWERRLTVTCRTRTRFIGTCRGLSFGFNRMRSISGNKIPLKIIITS